MVKKADVVLEELSSRHYGKNFGLGYNELKQINPKIIYATCSGFGQTGPYVHKPAYDIIVQAMGGIMSVTGPEGGEPTRVGASVGDIIAGLFTTIGVLMALYHRERTGEGQLVDVGMLDCQVAVLENAISRYLVSGVVPQPIGNRHPSITPFAAFTAKDGHIIVGAGNDRLWEKLCKLIDRCDLLQNELFSSNLQRTQHVKELQVILDAVFKEKTINEWMEALETSGVPCAPINTVDKVLNDPQIKAREMIVELKHPVAGQMKVPGVPIKLSATPGSVDTPAPLLGQHTEELLHELLGLSKEQVDALRAKNAI